MTKQKTILIASGTTHGIQDGLSAAIYVLLPILAQTFGLNYGQVGLFKAAKSLSQSVLEISSGLASERFGERCVLAISMAISGLGYLLLSFAGTPMIMLFCFLIMGVGGAYHHAPCSALVSQAYSTAKRRRALGFYNSTGDAGKLVFTATISLATMAAISWQAVAFGYGIISAGAGVVMYWTLKKSGIGDARHHARIDKGDAKLGWGILDRPKFFALLGTILIDSMVQAGVLTFVAFAMIAKGVPIYTATFASVLVLVGGMFGKAACGFLADHIGVRGAFSTLQGLAALGLVLLVMVPSTAAFILLPFLGVVVQGTSSITYVIVNDLIHPERTARGYSLVYSTTSIASVIGPLGFGVIGDIYGIEVAMQAMAVTSVAAILPCWFVRAC